MGRSFPLARFGVVGRSGAVVGLFRNPSTCPDLETFFPKNAFQHIFLENASQIGLRIPEGIAPRTDQRQRSQKPASDSKRTIKPGVQGQSPGPLSPHFSGEMGTPPGQAGPPGRCAPRPVSALPTRRVRSTGLPLAGGLGWDHRRSRPATWFPARLRAGARLSPEKAGGKSAGGLAPWTPFFYGPLVPTRSFWRLCRIVPVVGLFRNPSTCPDLGRFFVWGYTTQRLPLGGKLSPKVTDKRATGLPNGAIEKPR